MATIKLILWSRKKADNTYSIKVRIAKNNQSKYIPSEWSVKRSEWNSKNGKVRPSHPNHVKLNDELEELLLEVKDVAKELRSQNPSAGEIKDAFLGRAENPQDVEEEPKEDNDFFSFTKTAIQRYKVGNKFANERNTKAMLRKVREFWKKDELPFGSIDLKFLKDYESHLQGLGKKQSTIAKDFSRMRKMINEAIDEEIIDIASNPFLRFKVKRGKPKQKTKLSIEEMRLLADYPVIPGSRSWDVINLFRFQFYCGGSRIGDALQLRWSNVVGNRLVYEMDKTDEGSSPILVQPALDILSRYISSKEGKESFIFPFLSNDRDYSDPRYLRRQIEAKTALVNKYLKMIARKAGIEKKVTTHVARHSMADYLRRSKASVYDISKILGHSSIQITEFYLASLDQESSDGVISILESV